MGNSSTSLITSCVTANGCFKKLEALNVEGMVVKRKDSVYSGLPNRDWLKVRTSAGKTTIQKRIET
jgi:ATP-dependent DNA ligase